MNDFLRFVFIQNLDSDTTFWKYSCAHYRYHISKNYNTALSGHRPTTGGRDMERNVMHIGDWMRFI